MLVSGWFRPRLVRRCWAGLTAGALLVNLAAGQAPVTERLTLSGTDKDHTVPWEFRVSGGRQAGVWTTIPVPSCWETQGFGSYKYGSWSPSDEYGEYRHAFTVPAAWAGRRVFLVYEGAMTETETRLNGAGAGTTLPPLTDDRALNNSAATPGGAGGVARSATGNLALGTRSAFTLTAWIRPAGSVTTGFPRLMLLGAAAGYDAAAGQGAGAYFAGYNSSGLTGALQFKVNADVSNGALSRAGVLGGSDWLFVAVTYDSALPAGHVKFYVGGRASALTGPVDAVNYPAGPVAWGAAAHAYLLNRDNRGRAFSGWGDDFRIYDGALSTATLEAVRASALYATVVSPATGLLYQWNFNVPVSGPTAAPQVGAGGVLTLRNAANVAADLHTAPGDGASATPAGAGFLHRGGFTEFSHEVTDRVIFGGTNLLEVTVRKTSGDTSINDAERAGDYWNFGGLHRPVHLEARPPAHLERIAVDPRHTGALTVDAFVSGLDAAGVVTARVTTLAGAPVGADFTAPVAAGAPGVRLSTTIAGVTPWSHEFPQLYRLVVELRDAATGVLRHTHSETMGFRTVALVPGEGFHLNGRRVRLRGTVHHEFWPTTGRTTSRAQSIADLELLKAMGLNAVRRAHYPASRHFYEEADRLGILVLDELPGWQKKYSDTAAPPLVRELVTRNVNHPSVIAWGNGNEGGWNTTVDDDFALWDPQARPVIHPANWDHAHGGLKTHHYTSYAQVQGYLGAGKTAFMPTENLHGLYDGGAGAGLADYWDLIRTAPNGAGLFIWSFLDEALRRDDWGGAIDYVGDAAPDGILGPFREKEASYHTVRALWSQVQLTPQLADAAAPALTVENRFDFTNLAQCSFRWTLGWFPDPTDPAAALDQGFLPSVESAPFAGPAIAPGASGALPLDLPAGWIDFDALRCTATDPQGREIYTWTWPLRPAAALRTRIVPAVAAVTAGAPALSVTAGAGELTVTAGARTFRFSSTNGRLLGAAVGGQPVSLAQGPRPVTGSWPVETLAHGWDGADYLITCNDPAASAHAFQWRVRPDGWLRLAYRTTVTGPQAWLGVTFDYPATRVTALRWLGEGPYRVWKNRRAGQELAVHRKTANDTSTGKQWGYPEFRGYHGRLHWATLETTEQPITLVTPTPDLFLRVLTWPEASNSRPGVNVAAPPGDLSLLHAINAIGHKFGDAASLGPSGALFVADGLYQGEVDFYFGPLPLAATDRDADGLTDAWEWRELGSLASVAADDPVGDGVPLLLKNAFDLPLRPSATEAERLPRLDASTPAGPVLRYRVPAAQLERFTFVPEISRDLGHWERGDGAPAYVTLTSTREAEEWVFAATPAAAWPPPRERLFLRLQVSAKPAY